MKKKRLIISILVLFFVTVVIGLGIYLVQTRKETEDEKVANARLLLKEIYAVTQTDQLQFLSLSNEQDMMIWLETKYGKFLTKKGFEGAIQNRILTRGILLIRDTDQQITVKEIVIEERPGDTATNWYNYRVTLGFEDASEKNYSGALNLISEDSGWVVDKITRNN